MSNSNTFNNNLVQTSINDAYNFHSFSTYINNNINSINSNLQQQTRFSPHCIFCSSNNTISLINDGSFRQCKSCNKQFKSQFINK